MNRFAKRLITGAFARAGLEIRRAGTGGPPPAPDLWPWLRSTQQIRTLIDIGAHTGEFAAFLARYFEPSATYVFEPLPSCVAALREKAGLIPNLQIFQVALSDESGDRALYENSYAPATSLLRVSQTSKAEFPETSRESPTMVRVARLDDLLDPDPLAKDILIKIDIQGLEDRAIRGGRRMFRAAQSVLIEMAFVRMYEGQPLFEEVHALLVELGFRFAGIKNQIDSPRTGQPLFAHCLYLKANDVPAGGSVEEEGRRERLLTS